MLAGRFSEYIRLKHPTQKGRYRRIKHHSSSIAMDASEPQMIELESEVMRESTHGMAASDSSVIFPILSPLIFF